MFDSVLPSNKEHTIILASASPRRKHLLREIGMKFRVDPSSVDESGIPYSSMREFAIKAAFAKAEEVANRSENALVIGADTIVCLGDQILGKPHVPEEARRMLSDLKGRSHSVITGVAVMESGAGNSALDAEETRVFFKDYSQKEMEEYIATGEPLDKAGGYGIQGSGGDLVKKIEGDYFNVVGLPLELLFNLMSGFTEVDCYLEKLKQLDRPF